MNITEKEIRQKLQQFASSDVVDELKEYYSTTSSWEISNNARKETKHTLFLNWFFNNNKLNKVAIHKLLCLLLRYSENQNTKNFPESLADSIYIRGLELISCVSNSEIAIDDNLYGEGNIDILINCEARLSNNDEKIRKINIIIENKLYSPETTKKGNKGGLLYQTDAYFKYITASYPDDINIFVFLKPTTNYYLENLVEPECHNKAYIQINYQELLDSVIQPTIDKLKITDNDKFLIEDYIRALSKPSEIDDKNNITIMAIPKKEKELLKKFFEQNEDLIRAAIESIGDEELTDAMQKTPKAGIRLYSINGQGTYSNVQVIEEFVKMRLTVGKSISDINDEMNSYMSKNSQRQNVSDSNGKVIREDVHFYEFTFNNNTYKICKEWSDKVDSNNFAKLRKKITELYPNLKIEQIQ